MNFTQSASLEVCKRMLWDLGKEFASWDLYFGDLTEFSRLTQPGRDWQPPSIVPACLSHGVCHWFQSIHLDSDFIFLKWQHMSFMPCSFPSSHPLFMLKSHAHIQLSRGACSQAVAIQVAKTLPPKVCSEKHEWDLLMCLYQDLLHR